MVKLRHLLIALGAILGAWPGAGFAQGAPAANPDTAPVWLGFAALGVLLAAFGVLGWWLYFAPLQEPVPAVPTSAAYQWERQRLVLLFMGGFILMMAAFQWDVSWHVPTGLLIEDFLWPPHLAIYSVYALNAGIGLFGLLRLLRLPGSLRARFRAEPLYGLIAFVSACQMSSAPSDEIWHRVYGKDLAIWALPHLLILVFYLVVVFAAIALQCDLLARQGGGPRRGLIGPEGILVVLLATGLWGAHFYAVLDWEAHLWGNTPLTAALTQARPAWQYPVAGLVAGAFMLGMTIQVLRRAGAATLVVVTFNVLYLLTVGLLALFGERTPLLASSLWYIPGALALDAWCRWYGERQPAAGRALGSGAAFAIGYLIVGIPVTVGMTRLVELTPADVVTTVVVGLAGGALALVLGAGLGTWLQDLSSRLAATPRRDVPSSPAAQVPGSTLT